MTDDVFFSAVQKRRIFFEVSKPKITSDTKQSTNFSGYVIMIYVELSFEITGRFVTYSTTSILLCKHVIVFNNRNPILHLKMCILTIKNCFFRVAFLPRVGIFSVTNTLLFNCHTGQLSHKMGCDATYSSGDFFKSMEKLTISSFLYPLEYK